MDIIDIPEKKGGNNKIITWCFFPPFPDSLSRGMCYSWGLNISAAKVVSLGGVCRGSG